MPPSDIPWFATRALQVGRQTSVAEQPSISTLTTLTGHILARQSQGTTLLSGQPSPHNTPLT